MQETALQDVVADALAELGVEFEREFKLSGSDRVDFFLKAHGLGIEVKKGNASNEALRQVARYLEHPECLSCVLVALRGPADAPPTISGKTLRTIELWKLLL